MSIPTDVEKSYEDVRFKYKSGRITAVTELINILNTSELDTAIQTLKDKYGAKLIFWYEPAGYEIIWEHKSIKNQDVSGCRMMNKEFYTLIQATYDPTQLVFIIGHLGKTNNYIIKLATDEVIKKEV
jgi:hypothetical protein